MQKYLNNKNAGSKGGASVYFWINSKVPGAESYGIHIETAQKLMFYGHIDLYNIWNANNDLGPGKYLGQLLGTQQQDLNHRNITDNDARDILRRTINSAGIFFMGI